MTTATLRARRRQISCALLMALALGTNLVDAQDAGGGGFPNRPITIIVPFAAGGGTDIVARMLGNELGRRWKTSVVVESKPGASGQIGNAMAARAKPDGYTILIATTTLIQEPGLYKKLPYNAAKDLTPVAQVATSNYYLVVPASSPANSLKEFVAYAKSHPGRLSYGSNGNGGSSHLIGSLFNSTSKLDMVHVPFSGSAPLLTALLGQQVDVAFVDISPLRAQLGGGKLKVLAGTGPRRSPILPNVPTMSEEGQQGFEPVGWFGMFVPSGVPAAVRKTIADGVVDVLKTPEVARRFEELGLALPQVAPDAFADRMREDTVRWEQMIKAGNVTVE